MFLIGLLAFALSATLSLFLRAPVPSVHDEFSYLLAGDTFAHGRLSNPPHPMWRHFETMHVIQQPTYASKYPPVQGIVLAFGEWAISRPILGIWLSTALASAALCWMLQGWFSPRWALCGGLLATLHPLLLGWGQNYWGGSVAVAGGALVLGSVRRVLKRPHVGHSVLLGLGMALLANSRPYEGVVLCIPCLAALVVGIVRQRAAPLTFYAAKVFVPVVGVLGVAAGCMGLYNLRVTGSPLRMPYAVHEDTYAIAPAFLWQPLRTEPTYAHKELRDFYLGWAPSFYRDQQSFRGFIQGAAGKLRLLAVSYFPNLGFQLPLLALPWFWRRGRWARFTLLTAAFSLAALLPETWMQAHYAAPMAGLVLILVVQGARHLRVCRLFGKPRGTILLLVCLVFVLLGVVDLCATLARVREAEWGRQRALLESELTQSGERHLVVVRYGPNHSLHAEWVYNAADIDGAPVVWAREMSGEQNRRLLDYFRDRRVWLLEADADTPKLAPYPSRQND